MGCQVLNTSITGPKGSKKDLTSSVEITPLCSLCQDEYNKYNKPNNSIQPFVELEPKPGDVPEETSFSVAKDSADCEEELSPSPRVKLSALLPSVRQEERQRQVSI